MDVAAVSTGKSHRRREMVIEPSIGLAIANPQEPNAGHLKGVVCATQGLQHRQARWMCLATVEGVFLHSI